MYPIIKKENVNSNYIHRTQEAIERSKSQNKNPKIQHRIKSGRPAFSSKKENINNGIINGEGSIDEKLNELRKENNNHINSAKEIVTNPSSKVKKDNYSQSFLNDYNLNIQVSNSLHKNGNKQDEKTNNSLTIQESEIEETQRLIIKQKKNNFIKNNQSQEQKLQNNIMNAGNNHNSNNINQNNYHVITKEVKHNQIKIRQRSNSPTILKMNGQQQLSHQNRIISANLHSKAVVGNIQQIDSSDFKINGQNMKKKKEQDEGTINSVEDSIYSNIQKDKVKQGVVAKQNSKIQKKKIEREQSDAILSSNNSSDAELNEDKRVKSISMTPGIVYHNQYNLKESQNTFDVLETSNYTHASEKRKSIESENKLPRINRLNARSKETTLYNQLRESNQKNALELPQIIDNIKQNVNSCENLFKNRLKDRIGEFQGQFQQASVNNFPKKKEEDMDQYDFEVNQRNCHEQFDRVIQKNQHQKGKEHIPSSILNSKNMNSQRQIESAHKRDSIQPFTNRQNTKDDFSVKQESPKHILKQIRQSQHIEQRQSQHSEQRENVNRRDSSISYIQQGSNTNAVHQQVQVRNRIKSEHNVMQNNSSSNYPSSKMITEDSETEPNSTADRNKLKKLNQINKYLKNKMDIQKQIITQVGSTNNVSIQQNNNNSNNNNSNNNSNNNNINNNSNNINNNGNMNGNNNVNQKSQPHKQIQLQIQQQQLLQISKNQQLALSNQKQQNAQKNETNQEIMPIQPQQINSGEYPQSNKNQYQKGVIEVLDQALFKRKEDKAHKSISQQIEKEMDKLNILTSKSSSARDEQLKIQEELIKYNLKIKLNKMKIVDTVLENLQEEYQ